MIIMYICVDVYCNCNNSARVMIKMRLQSTVLSKISSSISRRGRGCADARQVDDELDRSIHASSSSRSLSRTRHTKKGHNDVFHRLHLLNRLPNATTLCIVSSVG